MEKNTVIAAAGTSVSGGGNLYPNTLYKVPEEVRKKSSSAKPELADKVAPACFLYAVFLLFASTEMHRVSLSLFTWQELSALLSILSEDPVFPGEESILGR